MSPVESRKNNKNIFLGWYIHGCWILKGALFSSVVSRELHTLEIYAFSPKQASNNVLSYRTTSSSSSFRLKGFPASQWYSVCLSAAWLVRREALHSGHDTISLLCKRLLPFLACNISFYHTPVRRNDKGENTCEMSSVLI